MCCYCRRVTLSRLSLYLSLSLSHTLSHTHAHTRNARIRLLTTSHRLELSDSETSLFLPPSHGDDGGEVLIIARMVMGENYKTVPGR